MPQISEQTPSLLLDERIDAAEGSTANTADDAKKLLRMVLEGKVQEAASKAKEASSGLPSTIIEKSTQPQKPVLSPYRGSAFDDSIVDSMAESTREGFEGSAFGGTASPTSAPVSTSKAAVPEPKPKREIALPLASSPKTGPIPAQVSHSSLTPSTALLVAPSLDHRNKVVISTPAALPSSLPLAVPSFPVTLPNISEQPLIVTAALAALTAIAKRSGIIGKKAATQPESSNAGQVGWIS